MAGDMTPSMASSKRWERVHEGSLTITRPRVGTRGERGGRCGVARLGWEESIRIPSGAAQLLEIDPWLEHPLGRLARPPALIGDQVVHRHESRD